MEPRVRQHKYLLTIVCVNQYPHARQKEKIYKETNHR